MRWRVATSVVALQFMLSTLAAAQGVPGRPAEQYVDSVNGLTVAEAIAQALRREPYIRAERARIDIARGAERQAALRSNPTLSFERREEPGGTDNQTMASVQWPLELFRVEPRKAVAERERLVAELSVSDRERLLAAEVRQHYGELLVAVRELAVLDDMVASFEKQRELLDARVKEGAAPALDRDLVEVELRRWQADQVLQMGRTSAALIRLKRAVGLSPGDPLKVRHTLEAAVKEQRIAQPAAPPDMRADVREAEAMVALAEAKIDRARRNGRFDVSLFGSYARMDAGFMQQGFGRTGELERVRGLFNYVSGGVAVVVPLFNRSQGEVAAAQAERVGAQAAFEGAMLDASSELAAAHALEERAREGLGIFSEEARTRALRNLEVIRESYVLGRATMFDVLTEQRRYLDLERAYTSALQSAYEAWAMLLSAQGAL